MMGPPTCEWPHNLTPKNDNLEAANSPGPGR